MMIMKHQRARVIGLPNSSAQKKLLKDLHETLREQNQISKASSFINKQIKEQNANKKEALEKHIVSLHSLRP